MGKPPAEAKSATIQHFSHAHPLNLTSVESQAALVPPSCSCCTKRITSWAYTCHHCRFFLHTECSNLPQLVNHQCHTIHNLTLLANNKDQYVCAACGESGEGFSYHCHQCSFNLHTACSVMPTHLSSHSHHHQLSLAFRSPYLSQTFSCDVCRGVGSKWLYRCNICEFDAHLKCAKEAPVLQPGGGGGPPVLVSPVMVSPGNVAPILADERRGNTRRVVDSVKAKFSSASRSLAPNMVPLSSGYAGGYVPDSHVTFAPMHQGSYNGSVTAYPVAGSPFFDAQSGHVHSTPFPAQFAVPQGFNGNQPVNQQRDGNSLPSQLLRSVVSGAASGVVGSILSGGLL